MRRSAAVLALMVMAVPPAAIAQDSGTPQEREACYPDVMRHCRGIHGNLIIASCLVQHHAEISMACQQVLANHGLLTRVEPPARPHGGTVGAGRAGEERDRSDR